MSDYEPPLHSRDMRYHDLAADEAHARSAGGREREETDRLWSESQAKRERAKAEALSQLGIRPKAKSVDELLFEKNEM